MRSLLLRLIAVYQRRISPHKGFSCAYRVTTGRCSCSNLGLRAIRWKGSWRGLLVLRERLHRCGVAYRRAHSMAPLASLPGLTAQRGVCDLSCDAPGGCELGGASADASSGCDLACGACDAISGCPCGDCGGRGSRSDGSDRGTSCGPASRRDDKRVHIPPRRTFKGKGLVRPG